MRRPRLSSQFIGQLVITTLAAALAAVLLLGATAFAQGNASQDQYTNEPMQSDPSTAPATDAPGPDSTAPASPDASQKPPTPDSTAPATDPPTSEPTTAPATETPAPDATAPTAPNASQECPWEPIPPGAFPGGPSGCPWWRGTPGGSSRVHPTRGQLPEGQCYDTQLGVTYSCSGEGQLQKPGQPGQPHPPPGPRYCLGGQSCDGVPNPGSKQSSTLPRTIPEAVIKGGQNVGKWWEENTTPGGRCGLSIGVFLYAEALDLVLMALDVLGAKDLEDVAVRATKSGVPFSDCIELFPKPQRGIFSR
jgi:hypothetical protein